MFSHDAECSAETAGIRGEPKEMDVIEEVSDEESSEDEHVTHSVRLVLSDLDKQHRSIADSAPEALHRQGCRPAQQNVRHCCS